MPRLSRSLPAYRKHRSSGQAVVTLNGRDYYLGPHGTRASKSEYDRLIGEWLAAGRTAPLANAEALTVVELISRYWRFAKLRYVKNGQPTDEQSGIKAALRFVRVAYGKTPAAEFGPLALKAVRLRMIKAGLARSTVNKYVNRVRRMFRWAVSEELVPMNQYHGLMAVEGVRKGRDGAREAKPVLPVDDATIDATIPHLPSVVADMVRVARLSGMRPTELCLLRPVDLDRSGDIWLYRPATHKTEHHNRGRTVCLGPRSQSILLRYLARAADAYCFSPRDSETKRRAEQHALRVTPLSCGDRPGSKRTHKPKRSPGDCYTDLAPFTESRS